MEHSDFLEEKRGASLDYLRVNDFIKDMVTARALTTAFELRIIDVLIAKQSVSYAILKQVTSATDNGLRLLLKMLEGGSVLEKTDDEFSLTPQFNAALRYRDLLLAKLDFAHIAGHDFIDSFTVLAVDPLAFMKRAGMFRLFDYGCAMESTAENRKRTARWMRITTMLTRYEAPSCFLLHSVGKYRQMLDVGGNSGEFALQACKTSPKLQATIFDLPVVCDIGCDHLQNEPESVRINFLKGNARTDDLPTGFDLITFKSMLHDWPDEEVRRFIHKACHALEPGGTLLIYERGPFEVGDAGLTYANLPILLFAHTLRSPDLYMKCLAENGFDKITLQWIELEMPFFIVTGVKKINTRTRSVNT